MNPSNKTRQPLHTGICLAPIAGRCIVGVGVRVGICFATGYLFDFASAVTTAESGGRLVGVCAKDVTAEHFFAEIILVANGVPNFHGTVGVLVGYVGNHYATATVAITADRVIGIARASVGLADIVCGIVYVA
jgi:hypothetical protein